MSKSKEQKTRVAISREHQVRGREHFKIWGNILGKPLRCFVAILILSGTNLYTLFQNVTIFVHWLFLLFFLICTFCNFIERFCITGWWRIIFIKKFHHICLKIFLYIKDDYVYKFFLRTLNWNIIRALVFGLVY